MQSGSVANTHTHTHTHCMLPYMVYVSLHVSLYVHTPARRVDIRRKMNQMENQASAKAVDSLINFETVKYFNNEALEARRYNSSLVGCVRNPTFMPLN